MNLLAVLFLTLLSTSCFVNANPLAGKKLFVRSIYTHQIQSTMGGATPDEKKLLRKVLNVPTAQWLALKNFLNRNERVDTILKLAASKSNSPLVTFVVYNLPNRDCSAGASSGEFSCQSGLCEDGLRRYRKEFIDPLAVRVKSKCGKVPMAFIIEPDALGNLLTGGGVCQLARTKAAYEEGIKYAVQKLKEACPSSPLYLDAGNGAWLGWAANSAKYMALVKKFGIARKLRGFAINISNYQSMGILCPYVGFCERSRGNRGHPCCQGDTCGHMDYNPGFTALNYAASLRKKAAGAIPGFNPHFLIDTSRNGVTNTWKASCQNWCNIRGAGVGRLPTTRTREPGLVDAYMWIKPPGESDGCTQKLPNGKKCQSYAGDCSSPDSVGSRGGEPRAPAAGKWFGYHMKSMLKNGRRNLGL